MSRHSWQGPFFFPEKHIPFKKQLFFEKLYFYDMFGPTRPTQNDRGNRVVISCFGPKPCFTIVFTSQTCIFCSNPHFSISFLINSILHRQSTSRCVQASWQGPFVFPEITHPWNCVPCLLRTSTSRCVQASWQGPFFSQK